MRCPIESEENLDLLLAYSAGERNAGTAALEPHLEVCPRCKQFVQGQPAVWAALEEWEPPAVSADFNRRLYHRIENEVPWHERLLGRLRPQFGWRAVPVAAAAGVLITAGIWLQRPSGVPAPPEAVLIDTWQPEQVVRAMDDLELLDTFDRAVRADSARPEL